jgi:cell division protein FtsB
MHAPVAKATSIATMGLPLLAQVGRIELPAWVGVAGALGLAALGGLMARTFSTLDKRDDAQQTQISTLKDEARQLRAEVRELRTELAVAQETLARCRNCRLIIAG